MLVSGEVGLFDDARGLVSVSYHEFGDPEVYSATYSSNASKGPRVELRGREAGELISIVGATSKFPIRIKASYIWRHCDDVFEWATPFLQIALDRNGAEQVVVRSCR